MSDRAKDEGPIAGEWPNTFRTREELDSMLEAGEASGVSNRSFEEIVDAAFAKVAERKRRDG